jgi:hypothetical protein
LAYVDFIFSLPTCFGSKTFDCCRVGFGCPVMMSE